MESSNNHYKKENPLFITIEQLNIQQNTHKSRSGIWNRKGLVIGLLLINTFHQCSEKRKYKNALYQCIDSQNNDQTVKYKTINNVSKKIFNL